MFLDGESRSDDTGDAGESSRSYISCWMFSSPRQVLLLLLVAGVGVCGVATSTGHVDGGGAHGVSRDVTPPLTPLDTLPSFR